MIRNKITKIILYNNFHNGDIFFSRFIVNMILEKFPELKISYKHGQKKGLLRDYNNIVEEPLDNYCNMEDTVKIVDSSLYINTWYGQDNRKIMQMGGGTTLETVNIIINNILNFINEKLTFNKVDIYPSVYFSNLKIDYIPKYGNILICNDDSMSGQSNNIDLISTIIQLSKKYKNNIFYVTKKIDFYSDNIFYVDDIFQNRPNLLEISYISNYSSIIIGRCSGPYSFCMTKQNILDEHKTLIAICGDYLNGIWDRNFYKCNYLHLPTNNISEIQFVIETEIDKKHI